MRHLIDPLDLTQQEITQLLDLADRICADPAAYQEVANHKKLDTFSLGKPSTWPPKFSMAASKDSRVRDRLYYACTGWIGRNVFFRWKTGHTPSEFTQRNRQLAAGAKALARYTNDRRFLYLPDIQSAAESWLPDMIGQYQKSKEAWNELTERWFGR